MLGGVVSHVFGRRGNQSIHTGDDASIELPDQKIYKRLIEVCFLPDICLGKAHSPVHPLYPFYISRLDPNLGIVRTHDRRELAGCRSFVFHVLEHSATESSRYLTSRYLSLPRRKKKKKKRTEFSLIPAAVDGGPNLIAQSLL